MDLPPPPPPPLLFRHHLRYGNVFHPPDFVPPPYAPPVLPPPPPSYTFLPPPPSAMGGYIAPPPISPRFAFSPPHQSIIDRRRLYEFDPINKPYVRNEILPPPPPPPRENIPFRFIGERNPMLNDEVRGRVFSDNYRPGNCGQDLRWDCADEYRGRVVDIGVHERYSDRFSQRHELLENRDYDNRRLDNRISDWTIKKNYEERGCDGGSDLGRDLYRRRDCEDRRCYGGISDRAQAERRDYDGRRHYTGEGLSDERRWDIGTRDWGHMQARDFEDRQRNNGIDWGRALSNDRDYDEMRLNNGIDGGRALTNGNDYDQRRWNGVTGDQGRVMCSETDYDVRRNNGICDQRFDWDDDGRRSNFGSSDRTSFELENIQPESLEDDFTMARTGDWLCRDVSKGEVMETKRRRLLKSHRVQSGKACNRNSGGYKSHPLSKNLSNSTFKGKEIEGFEKLQTRLEDKLERERSPVELDLSFKSNALIGRAISVSSRSDVKTDFNEMETKNIEATDSRGVLQERLVGVAVSGSGGAYACDVKSPNKIFVKNEVHRDKISPGPSTFIPGRAQLSRRKKRARQRARHRMNTKMPKACDNIINSNNGINGHFLAPQSNLDSTVLEGITSSAGMVMGSDISLLSSFRGVISKKGEGDLDSCKPSVSSLKRKSSSSTTFSGSLYDGNLFNTKCFDQESLTVSIDDACRHTDNLYKFIPNKVSVLDTETRGINSIDMLGTSQASETRNTELREEKYFSKVLEANLSSVNGSSLLQKPDKVPVSGVGLTDANLKISTSQYNLGGGVIANCSNVSLGISESTSFVAANHTDNIAQLDVSLDATRKNSFSDGASVSHIIDSAEGSPQTINHVKPGFSPNCTSGVIRKRKVRNARGLSDSKTVVDTGGSIVGNSARCLAVGLAPTADSEFSDVKDSSKEDNSFSVWASGVEDLNSVANGSHCGGWKKRKVVNSRANPYSLSEDATVADGLDGDSIEVFQWSTRLAGEREHKAAGVCDPSGVEGQVGGENITSTGIADLDVEEGEIVEVEDNPSLSADRHGDSASNSGDELLATGTFVRSCLSSPEVIPLYSDMSFLSNNKLSGCLSDNEMTSRKVVYNSKPANNLFSGKSVKKETSDNLQMKTRILPPLPQDNSKKAVKELNLVQGRLPPCKSQLTSAVPKVFPGHHAINFGNSQKFNSTCVTKSRTWHRPGNPIATVKESEAKPSLLPQSLGTKTTGNIQNSYVRKGNSLVRKDSSSGVAPPGLHGLRSTVYRLTTCTDKDDQASNTKTGRTDNSTPRRIDAGNVAEVHKALPPKHCWKSLNESTTNLSVSLPAGNAPRNSCVKSLNAKEMSKSSAVPECRIGSVNSVDSERTLVEDTSRKKIMYVKRRSNQLVAASSSDDSNVFSVDKTQTSSDNYYKNRKNQLVRATEELQKKGYSNAAKGHGLVSRDVLPRTSSRRLPGFAKSYRSSKLPFVWKLHDTQCLEKHNNSLGPRKVLPRLFPWKSATRLRSFIHALSTKVNSSFSSGSLKLLLSRKRGAIYTRSGHGYSLKMSKVLSVSGSSLKWSKSIEKNSKKASEDATRAVAAAEKRKKEGNVKVPVASKGRTHVSRERIFRIGSERYRMDPTRRSLHRISAEGGPSSSLVQSENTAKRSYVPRRLVIGNNEYVRIGNGNQLIRDPKKRTRILASEKVRWSLRTARLRLARKRKYCQFFTRFGKCNKDDGKCPYIHDPSKIAVCTKFLRGSCSNTDCKLTHKVIPERMQDCSYFLKGLCSNENCPYRHVNVNPDSAVCESFLRGYCADGNECPKKHTYVCPAFEVMGSCPQASTCKLHHPKRKEERKPPSEPKSTRGGRYFDGGLVGLADDELSTTTATEKLSTRGKDEGTFPDYISLEVSDDETDLEIV